MGNINLKLGVTVFSFLVFVLLIGWIPQEKQTSKDDFPILKGPYLGQQPPGMTPEIFAPGVISTDSNDEFCSVFTPDAKMFLFVRLFEGMPLTISLTEMKDGKWTKPSPPPFNSEYNDWDYNIAPDGRTLYFTSVRPVTEGAQPSKYGNIWVTQLTASGWTPPRVLEYPINTPDSDDQYASVTKDGTLYFFSGRNGGFGKLDIYRARLFNGKYPKVENLGKVINTEYSEFDLYVAPDESYLIFCSNRPGGYIKGNEIYITFRQKDGSWTNPQNLGSSINTEGYESWPFIAPDERYLLFESNSGTIYISFRKNDGSWTKTINMAEKIKSKGPQDRFPKLSNDGKYLFFVSNRRIGKPYFEKQLDLNEIIVRAKHPGNGLGDVYWIDASII